MNPPRCRSSARFVGLAWHGPGKGAWAGWSWYPAGADGTRLRPAGVVRLSWLPRQARACGARALAGCPSGQWERSVKPSRKLQWFESTTRHTQHVWPLTWVYQVWGRVVGGPVESGRVRLSTAVHGNMA